MRVKPKHKEGKPGTTEPFLRCFWNPLWDLCRVPTPSSCSSDESLSMRQHLPRAQDRERRCEQIGCETETSSKTSNGCQEWSVQGFTLHAKDTHGEVEFAFTPRVSQFEETNDVFAHFIKVKKLDWKRKIRLAGQLGSGRVGEEPAGPLGWGRRRQLKAHQNREGTGLKGQEGELPSETSKECHPTGRVHHWRLRTRPGSPPPNNRGNMSETSNSSSWPGQLKKATLSTSSYFQLCHRHVTSVQLLCIVESYGLSV